MPGVALVSTEIGAGKMPRTKFGLTISGIVDSSATQSMSEREWES
jgi:hypothetical protein